LTVHSVEGEEEEDDSKSVFNNPQRKWRPGLPDFSLHNIPKRGKYTKVAQTYQNGHKMHQMDVVYCK
jgi:hypothetical protein